MIAGITSTTYLTRGLLEKLFNKPLSNEEITELVFSGKLSRKFSYYQPTETLLREIGVIPTTVVCSSLIELSKRQSFTMQDIMRLFSNCNKDTGKAIISKYFYRKYNYYYKKDMLNELLLDGCTEFEI